MSHPPHTQTRFRFHPPPPHTHHPGFPAQHPRQPAVLWAVPGVAGRAGGRGRRGGAGAGCEEVWKTIEKKKRKKEIEKLCTIFWHFQCIFRMLSRLPKENVLLLRHLLALLHTFQSNAQENHMTSLNLSVCISASMLWQPGPPSSPEGHGEHRVSTKWMERQ